MFKFIKIDWNNLKDAYGPASEIPQLLEQVYENTNSHKAVTDEPWFSLWSRLCHQGDVYTASYAAVLYLAQIAEANKDKSSINWNLFLLPASIEIARVRKGKPDLPEEIEKRYQTAIQRLGDYSQKYQTAKDENLKRSAQAMRLVADNKIEEAGKILDA